MPKKFYEIKNITNTSADMYVYGEICWEKRVDWWTGEKSETDVDIAEFKKELDEIGDVETLNLYVNSPGGSVFAASTIVSMLRRLKDKGTKIEAYIDGLAASAASFLIMIADNIHTYPNSIMMVHKPMTFTWGWSNAQSLQKDMDQLEQIEKSTMLPMYMAKAKEGIAEEEIKELIANESWMGQEEITKYFNVIEEEEEKAIAACTNKEMFAGYKNVPKELIEQKNTGVTVNLSAILDINKLKEELLEEIRNETNTKEKPPEVEQEEIKPEETNNDKENELKAKLQLTSSFLFIKKYKEKEGN